MVSYRKPAEELLAFLGLERETPSLHYLDRLIREHQLRVPFETLTKLIDYEPGRRRGDFLPSFEEYVERIVKRGAGGLCWTLARGFHHLLTDLGFDAALMVMNPGHCCVRVELPQGPQYADVGYAAPIFRAYPLFESFSLATHRETFDYRVETQGIFVTRQPGPTKQLDPTPRAIDELGSLISAANDWAVPESFLRRLAYARHVDGVFTSLRGGILTRYLPTGPEVIEVPRAAAAALLTEVFGADGAVYTEAARILERYGQG